MRNLNSIERASAYGFVLALSFVLSACVSNRNAASITPTAYPVVNGSPTSQLALATAAALTSLEATKTPLPGLKLSPVVDIPANVQDGYAERIKLGMAYTEILPANLRASSFVTFAVDGGALAIGSGGIVKTSESEDLFAYTALHNVLRNKESGATKLVFFISEELGFLEIPIDSFSSHVSNDEGGTKDGIAFIKLPDEIKAQIFKSKIEIPQVLPDQDAVLRMFDKDLFFVNNGNGEISSGLVTSRYAGGVFVVNGPAAISCQTMSGVGMVQDKYVLGVLLGGGESNLQRPGYEPGTCSGTTFGSVIHEGILYPRN